MWVRTFIYFLLSNRDFYVTIFYCFDYSCKILRPCYKHMLDTLLDKDEASCIEDVSVGINTV